MIFSSLRFIDTADVYKGDVLAGRLRRSAGGEIAFTYLPGYSGTPVSTSLPLTDETITAGGGAVPSFFAGLLPEGHRLSVMARAVKTSLDDELTLLLAIGGDTPGDVRIVPHGQTPRELVPAVDLSDSRVDFRAISDLVDQVGLPGVQSKASASMITTPVKALGRAAILKIDPHDYPHLVINEALHLEKARGLGIPVSTHEVLTDVHGIRGLVVHRFDRGIDASGRSTRFALEDAGQVLGIWPAQKYSVNSEDVVLALAAQTHAPLLATRNLYIQFLYAWLTGNGDLHAKNVSILQDASGRWAVAPIYDVPSTALYEDTTMALPIAGRTKGLRLRHWDEFADSIGLPLRAARAANRHVLKVVSDIDLKVLPFEGSPLHAAERELRLRRAEIA
ncbi:MAG: HipA domain-containing protein [Schaalia hyovaginalis]|uniref:type II toxin-antitoxin system HipA family toxin n=1 Tax=Schaalia hyovaginalis TaxID=29316 RepID=UPI002A9140B9|nr:HipA domain-containing protein [Schaalia hyovaginalis]MDY6214127.1 HipA domain-containing protein [Schaalia hyovaginalis]